MKIQIRRSPYRTQHRPSRCQPTQHNMLDIPRPQVPQQRAVAEATDARLAEDDLVDIPPPASA